MRRTTMLPGLFLIVLAFSLPLIIAAALLQEIPAEVGQALFLVITALVGWFGPYPLEAIFKLVGAQGISAVALTYVIAGLVAAVAIYGATLLFGFVVPTDPFAVLTLLIFASQVSFNRLKATQPAKFG